MDNVKLSLDKLCRGHWSPRRILSYNKILNMVIGGRGSGKSTGWPMFLVVDYMRTRCNNPLIGEYPHLFTYSRLSEKAYNESCEALFDNVQGIIKDRTGVDVEIKYNGGEYIIDGQLAGYGFPLIEYVDHKSTNRRIYNMYLDEFIPEGKSNGQSGYNGGRSRPMFDPEGIMSLGISFDRQKSETYEDMIRNEVRIFMSGNNYSYNSPFYTYFGVDKYLRTDSHFIAPKGELWVLEQTEPPESYKKAVSNSNMARLMNARDREYSFENKPRTGTGENAFITHPKGVRNAVCNLYSDGYGYAVYSFLDSGILWIKEGANECCHMNIALTTEDHRPNYLMSIRYADTMAMKMLKDAYLRGYIRFSSAKAKYMIDNYFMFI